MEIAVHHGAKRLEISLEDAFDGQSRRIEDDGAGVPEETAETISRPFYTTRAEEGGTSMVRRIVGAVLAAHGATIRLDREYGAAFEIRKPRQM